MAELITAFWKLGMQSQGSRDAQMRERVAVASIYAQKIVDHWSSPEKTYYYNVEEPRTTDMPMSLIAHADLKNTEKATMSTFRTAFSYEDDARKRRDELLTKYAAEKKDQEKEA